MKVLGKYNRENPYSDDLKEAYDKYVTFDIDKVLEVVDMVRDGAPDSYTDLNEWLNENQADYHNPIYLKMVSEEFSSHFRSEFDQFIHYLNLFVKELLREERTIRYELEHKIRAILEDEVKMAKDEDYLLDKNIDELGLHCWRLMPRLYEQLADKIRRDFSSFLEDLIPEDEIDDEIITKVNQKVLILDMLGILDHLKKTYNELNEIPKLAGVIRAIIGEDASTIIRCLRDLDPKGKDSTTFMKNNPYNNETNIKIIRTKLLRYIEEKNI